MGLTSSQGRLLMLTSRLSDIQLDEILISQRQNQLAWQSEKVAKEYNEKISNTKLVMKVTDYTADKGYSMQDLSYSNMTAMGYLVTDANSNIYLIQNEDGSWNVPKANGLISEDQDIFSSDVYYRDAAGNHYTSQNEEGTLVAKIKLKNGEERYVVKGNELIEDKTKLQNNLMNGVLYVLNTTGNDTNGTAINQLESNTTVEWVQDTSDDAQAESKYNYETARLSRQDNQLDLELKQLETQHEAIIKEIESVEKVIDDNIDRTFKLFSD